ncbi:MAG: hypothetical protein ABUL62_17810 [Myxococcales bacterium]
MRQGQSNVVISLEQPGGGLSYVTRVDLGDLHAVIEANSNADHFGLYDRRLGEQITNSEATDDHR